MIQAQFSGEKVYSNSNEAFSLYEKSRFGERKENKIEYSLSESFYLFSKNKMKIFSNNKEISEETFLKKAKRLDKRWNVKYPVFENLRKRGYIVKTALKFGADFRVYKKGIKPGQDHALWILFPVKESESHNWYDFAAKNRVAHSARKKLLLAIVDDENSVTYYEVNWLKP